NRNILWMVLKNYPTGLLASSLPFVMGRILIVVPYYVLKGYGTVIIRSKIDAIAGFPKMFAKRPGVGPNAGNVRRFIRYRARRPLPKGGM
ncbi:MAG: glycosyltransferase family 2 protein, partial [Methanocella sp.]